GSVLAIEGRNLEKSHWSARSSRQAITKGATHLQLAWRLDFTRIYSLFADLGLPQNFVPRSDESSVNERRMVWRYEARHAVPAKRPSDRRPSNIKPRRP